MPLIHYVSQLYPEHEFFCCSVKPFRHIVTDRQTDGRTNTFATALSTALMHSIARVKCDRGILSFSVNSLYTSKLLELHMFCVICGLAGLLRAS